MKNSCKVFRAGTRSSPLALLQTRHAIDCIRAQLPGTEFQTVEIRTPGDIDRETELRASPPDFFTRTLDTALLDKRIDLAVHSAKDLPDPLPDGIDWFWLPHAADRRDALVGSLSPRVIGISSERRAAYAQKRFPGAELRPVRGNIGERLQQLDNGQFDLLIMAGAALQRLGLEERISEWIPVSDLDPPEAQGVLAVTFRQGDPPMPRLRSLFVKAVTFAGSGVCEGHLTLDARRALQNAEVCLYDALLDNTVLNYLPEHAQKIDVGKRRGGHGQSQDEINRILCDTARKGLRAVRLKGGDPGLFGRLAEEIEALEQLCLPYRVIPGISSMQTAAASSGILLTRRGTARGFTVMTPRLKGGATGPVGAAARAGLPIVFFMAVTRAERIADELMQDGTSGNTPCALVFSAGSDNEATVRSTLGGLGATLKQIREPQRTRPGLLIVGEIARFRFDGSAGALGNRRILLTCSDALMERAAQAVHDLGGRPVRKPFIRLAVLPQAVEQVRRMADFDWVALTSPSAVRCLHALVLREGMELRCLPRIMTTGPGTARALRQAGLGCDLAPEGDFSTKGLLRAAAGLAGGSRVLRLRSEKAGGKLADALRAAGADVTDCILYENREVPHPFLPEFDAVFFASASAAESLVRQHGTDVLQDKPVLVMGGPTEQALRNCGVEADVSGGRATVEETLHDLASFMIQKELQCFHKHA